MDKTGASDLVRKAFAAFMSQDRKMMDGLLSDDFTFNSPRDDHIGKAQFFERCFPNSAEFRSLNIEQLFEDGDEVLVRYQAELKDGARFRNMEYLRVEGGKIQEEDVYFGAPLAEKEPKKRG